MPYITINLDFEGYYRENVVEDLTQDTGVYCVYRSHYLPEIDRIRIIELLYIGSSNNIKERIQSHEGKELWKSKLLEGEELCYSYTKIKEENRLRVEAALIFKHKPKCNTEYQDNFPFEKTSLILKGEIALLNSNFTLGGN
jgi:excinuclease UvrABC nuclease subunit